MSKGIIKSIRLIPVVILLMMTIPVFSSCQQGDKNPVVADFTTTLTSGNAPLTVQFTDQSSGDISQWWWFFGDGQGSQQQNPSHTYTDAGVHSVTLIVIKPDDSYETVTREDYISVGAPVPGWQLTMREVLYWDYDLEHGEELVALDVAGEGILYWTSFVVKDKDEADWAVTHHYEHSIWVDEVECYGVVDSVGEIMNFQLNQKTAPDGFYPVVYAKGLDTSAQAFWRINIPFHEKLALVSLNNDPFGTITVKQCHMAYSLVSSGVPGSRGGKRGEEWSIEKVSDGLDFPAAPKIKAALEEHFSKKVYSVGVITRSPKDEPWTYSILWIDAPDIERDEIRDFLVGEGLVQLTYDVVEVDFTATPTSGSAPLTVQFTTQYTGDVLGWLWLFGDGQTSTEQNPSHTYAEDGSYPVTLVVVQSDSSYSIVSGECYISVGSPTPEWMSTRREITYSDYDLTAGNELVALDVAGEGILYWTSFIVKDKDEADWTVTNNYEQSIWVDNVECPGSLGSVGDIWTSQGKQVDEPGYTHPVIYRRSPDKSVRAFWQINTPFQEALALVLVNKGSSGTITVDESIMFYSLVDSGIPGSGLSKWGEAWRRYGDGWNIGGVYDKLNFPATPKIKTALEERFGKRVYSVGIITRSARDQSGLYSVIWIDAPDIEESELATFLREEDLIE